MGRDGQKADTVSPLRLLNLQGWLVDHALFTAETLVTFVTLVSSSCITSFLEVGMGSERGDTQHLKDGRGPVHSMGLWASSSISYCLVG